MIVYHTMPVFESVPKEEEVSESTKKSLVKMWIKEENVSISLEKISTCRVLGLNWT